MGTAYFTEFYDAEAPTLTPDVPEHPGLTYFTAWTERYPAYVAAVANDPVEVTNFEAKLVDAVDNDQDGDVDRDDAICAAARMTITLAGDEKRLELANNGKAFCIRATDIFGNLSAWSMGIPGFKTVATLTYGFGGVSVVERVGEDPANNEVVYVVGDHLGSASMAFEADGTVVADVRYLPFGEERWEEVDLPNERGFTGQRGEKGFGLVDFNARFYSPFLGRFISPDTIIPNLYNPQSWDRYTYVRNNAINYTDPTGHIEACEENCAEQRMLDKLSAEGVWKYAIKTKFGINMSDEGDKIWDRANLQLMYDSLDTINRHLNGSVRKMVEGATFKLWKHGSGSGEYNGSTHLQKPTGIDFYTKDTQALRQMNIFHEFGHLLDNVPGTWDVFTNAVSHENNPSWVNNDRINSSALLSVDITNDPNYASVEARQTYSNFGASEQWADSFGNYVADNIDLRNPLGPGTEMYNFVLGALAPYMGVPSVLLTN